MGRKRPTGTRPVTVTDLARLLRLDKSSVSLALRGSPKVSAATRRRVVAAAGKLGYVPNIAARWLSSSRPKSIELVLPSAMTSLSHPNAVTVIRSIASLAAAKGFLFSIVTSEELVRVLGNGSAGFGIQDGFLLWGDAPSDVAVMLQESRRPVVVVDPSHPSYRRYSGSTMAVANARGARQMTELFLARGAKRLLCVLESRSHLGQRTRVTAARSRWLRARPAGSFSVRDLSGFTEEDLRQWWSGAPRGGILCSNDVCAGALWQRLCSTGLRAPRDLILGGFDDDPYAETIGLTTIRPDWQALASRSLEALLTHIGSPGHAPIRGTVSVELIERTTTDAGDERRPIGKPNQDVS